MLQALWAVQVGVSGTHCCCCLRVCACTCGGCRRPALWLGAPLRQRWLKHLTMCSLDDPLAARRGALQQSLQRCTGTVTGPTVDHHCPGLKRALWYGTPGA